MSVLACDRIGCENIMCDRMSYKYGYICHSCFEELVSLAISHGQFPIPDTFIDIFMNSPKQCNDNSVLDFIALALENEFSIR